jgi:hypothetical protein
MGLTTIGTVGALGVLSGFDQRTSEHGRALLTVAGPLRSRAAEGLPVDALGRFDAHDMRLAKTASRHVLGVTNEMAFECGWGIDQIGGLSNIKTDELNHRLRRSLHTKHSQHLRPLELVLEKLTQSR